MIKFFKSLFDSKDSSVNSKIIGVVGALFLLMVTTFFILFGIPPVDAYYISDLIWGLVAIIIGGSGIEVANQIMTKNNGPDDGPVI